MPAYFLKFIGACEVAGALGLILPGLFKIHSELTALAAVGLVTIMTGATFLTAEGGQIAVADRCDYTAAPRHTARPKEHFIVFS